MENDELLCSAASPRSPGAVLICRPFTELKRRESLFAVFAVGVHFDYDATPCIDDNGNLSATRALTLEWRQSIFI